VHNRNRRAGAIRNLAAAAGVSIDPSRTRKPEAVAENLRRARELEAAIEKEEASEV